MRRESDFVSGLAQELLANQRLVEVTGNIWDLERIAEISVGVGRRFLDNFSDFGAKEKTIRLGIFRDTIEDLSDGQARSARLETKQRVVELKFEEEAEDPSSIIAYDEKGGAIVYNPASNSFEPVRFWDNHPSLLFRLRPRRIRELLRFAPNLPSQLEESLKNFAYVVLENFAQLRTDQEQIEIWQDVREMYERDIGPPYIVPFVFRFDESLIQDRGKVKVAAQPISYYL